MTITIKGDRKTARKLASIGQISVKSAAAARRKATVSGRKEAVKLIGRMLNLPAARIRKNVLYDQYAVFTRKGQSERAPTLAAYGGKFIKRGRRYAGYRVRVWRGLGTETIKNAFGIPKSVVPFRRITNSHNSRIEPRFGPRIGYVFSVNSDLTREFMQKRVVTEWKRAVRGRLARP